MNYFENTQWSSEYKLEFTELYNDYDGYSMNNNKDGNDNNSDNSDNNSDNTDNNSDNTDNNSDNSDDNSDNSDDNSDNNSDNSDDNSDNEDDIYIKDMESDYEICRDNSKKCIFTCVLYVFILSIYLNTILCTYITIRC